MSFTSFQKTEKTTVVSEILLLRLSLLGDFYFEDYLTASEYEYFFCTNAIAEQEQALQAKLDRALDYTN